jgi:hypothetical protein
MVPRYFDGDGIWRIASEVAASAVKNKRTRLDQMLELLENLDQTIGHGLSRSPALREPMKQNEANSGESSVS